MNPHPVAEYPRTYHTTQEYRRFCYFTATLLVTVTAIGVVRYAMGRNHASTIMAFVYPICLVGFAVNIWLKAHRTVTLREDGIDLTTWRGTRSLSRAEIEGRRFVMGGRLYSNHMYLIVPRDRSQRGMKLPPSMDTDRQFLDWMNGIPLLHH